MNEQKSQAASGIYMFIVKVNDALGTAKIAVIR
jgi:hypothetical protein